MLTVALQPGNIVPKYSKYLDKWIWEAQTFVQDHEFKSFLPVDKNLFKHDLFNININNLLWDQPAELQGQFPRRNTGKVLQGNTEQQYRASTQWLWPLSA